MEHTDLENLKTHLLSTDLLLVQGWQPPPDSLPEEEYLLHFFPKTFVQENKDITLEQFALKEGELLELGKMVTKLRAGILSKMEKEGILQEGNDGANLENGKKVIELRRRRQPGSIRKTE